MITRPILSFFVIIVYALIPSIRSAEVSAQELDSLTDTSTLVCDLVCQQEHFFELCLAACSSALATDAAETEPEAMAVSEVLLGALPPKISVRPKKVPLTTIDNRQ